MNKRTLHIILALLWSTILSSQYSISGVISDMNSSPIIQADVYEAQTQRLITTDANGKYKIDNLSIGSYQLTVYSFEYNTFELTFEITNADIIQNIKLEPLSTSMNAVEILARKKELFGLKRLNSVEGTAIYEGKKSEVIVIDQIVANLAANNPRQIYAQVAGLNIYESNDAGLQLNIGGRGLDPNRTSNFNTRQNGYDISADVLGYPESYYTPPARALSEIQVIRGAASLQYGTQFGGLVNFKMKRPSLKPMDLQIQQTIGSFGLKTTYVDVAGTSKKLSYFGYFNYKTGDGYRENSGFDSYNGYVYAAYQIAPKTKISVEGTYFKYLAQQAGGLTDSQFSENSRLSTRERNWFEVDWKLYSANLSHETKQTTYSVTLFGLDAERNAVGYRGNTKTLNSNPITDLDERDIDGNYLQPRDLIKGTFNNWGAEARVLHKYKIGSREAIGLIGMKYYNASNTSIQGPGTNGIEADFSLQLESFPDYSSQSSFEFPNRNIALFGEHIFKLTDKFSITPGLRYEYIKTGSIGEYQVVNFDAAGNPIFSAKLTDNNNLERSFLLAGVGMSFKPNTQLELYGNLSQNYRSVTFSDIRTISPSFIIDPDIADETGATMDIGVRGQLGKQFNYDAGIYSLLYDNRIGIILDDKANRVRKNIGTAVIFGLESFGEWNAIKSINEDITDRTLSLFVNMAITDSKYLSSDANDIEGKKVEFIPTLNIKTGIKAGYKDLLSSIQFSYLSEQFTDAENSPIALPGDSREGIIGTIPSYQIVDIAFSYIYKHITLSTGINNALDANYYTRRATGYPGPGIIPSDGRSYYLSVGYKL